MNAFKGSGRLFFALYDSNGVRGPYYELGNATDFSLQADGDTIEVTSTDNDNYGAALDSLVEGKPATGSMTINRFNRRNMAMAFGGSAAARSAGSSGITDEAATAVLDAWVKLANEGISSVVVTDITSTTTYVEGTDYEVNTDMGLLKALSTGSISESESLLVDYTKDAETGFEIAGGASASQRIALLLDGRNRFTGEKVYCDVAKATIKANGGFNFMAAEPAAQQFDITCIVAEGETRSFTVRVQQ